MKILLVSIRSILLACMFAGFMLFAFFDKFYINIPVRILSFIAMLICFIWYWISIFELHKLIEERQQ